MSATSEVSPNIFGTDKENFVERVPCVVIADGSLSMKGAPIEALNAGLKALELDLKKDERARRAARIMLIRVGGNGPGDDEVGILQGFQDGEAFFAPTLKASGSTPLARGVELALDMIEDEKRYLRSQHLNLKRPWLFVMTDGAPTDGVDNWRRACQKSKEAVRNKKVSIFPIVVDGGDAEKLQEITLHPNEDEQLGRAVAKMESAKFKEFFIWLSGSISGATGAASENPAMAPYLNSWVRA